MLPRVTMTKCRPKFSETCRGNLMYQEREEVPENGGHKDIVTRARLIQFNKM